MRYLLRRWRRDQQGGVVIFLAIAAPILILAVGIAVDMSRAQLLRSRLINAVDAATLSAGAVSDSQTDQIPAIVENYLNANIPPDFIGFTMTSVTIEVTNSSGALVDPNTLSPGDDVESIRVIAAGDLSTTFLGVIPALIGDSENIDSVPISTEAQVQRFNSNAVTLEVAMILDNSCSMGGFGNQCDNDTSRIDSLRTAATTLVNSLFDGEDNNPNVRVALVPFSQHVNQPNGTNNPPAAIAALGGGRVSDPNFTVPDNGIYSGNPSNGNVGYCFSLGNTSITQTSAGQGGCGAGQAFVPFPCAETSTGGNLYDCRPIDARDQLELITSFGQNRPGIISRINDLQPTGLTNTALGTQYGFFALNPANAGLFVHDSAPAAFSDDDVIKAAVIMTDGTNEVCANATGARPTAFTNNCNDLVDLRNQQQAELCTEMANNGITVFAVTFELGVTPAENAQRALFQNCATTPEFFFEADDGSELAAAFSQIAEELSLEQLRLVR